MPNPVVNFSYNWNGKLHCKCFPTIRLHNAAKYQVGKHLDVHYTNRYLGLGVIRHVTVFTIDKMTAAMALIDTGYALDEQKKLMNTMYKNKGINWATQQLAFVIIEMPRKPLLLLDDCQFEKVEEAA